MIGLEIAMPDTCRNCMFGEVYTTMSGDRNIYCECPVGFTEGEWIKDGDVRRHPDCPLIDLSQYEDDGK